MTARHAEVAVGAVVISDGRLLLVQRGREPGRGWWSIPGGRVEPGETLTEAVQRELAEETGLAGRCERFIGWVERIGEDHHFVILDFLVVVEDQSIPVAVAGDDAAAVAWVPLEELSARPRIVPGLVEFLVEHGIVGAIS